MQNSTLENSGMKICLLTFLISVGVSQAQVANVDENTPAMSQHYGHGTPKLSPLLDIDHKTYLVQPKGRWTLIYFWADWCIPCIAKGIPDLIAFCKTHEAQRDRFRIVAIRFGSTHENYEWKDFHAKTLHLEEAVWHQVPPFSIVDDDSSQFSTDWGIHALPTYALIDPEGNLVRDGDLPSLEKALASKN
jgi:thiol-disulfide isomerase/thioredoxin